MHRLCSSSTLTAIGPREPLSADWCRVMQSGGVSSPSLSCCRRHLCWMLATPTDRSVVPAGGAARKLSSSAADKHMIQQTIQMKACSCCTTGSSFLVHLCLAADQVVVAVLAVVQLLVAVVLEWADAMLLLQPATGRHACLGLRARADSLCTSGAAGHRPAVPASAGRCSDGCSRFYSKAQYLQPVPL